MPTRPASKPDAIALALRETLMSPNVSDSNWEAANVVDVLAMVARAIHDLADAVRETGRKP